MLKSEMSVTLFVFSTGRYGADCEGVCECSGGDPCHHVTGECSCPLGFTGSGCQHGK